MNTTHTEDVGDRAKENIPDHAGRTDSPIFVEARTTLHKITGAKPGTIQAHHGGSIWLHDGMNWLMVRNSQGIEWSSQFCADPVKVEALRKTALSVVGAFPSTIPELEKLGCKHAKDTLNQQITDEKSLADYVDSIWNSCVPLAAPDHTGVISAKTPHAAGEHNYPKPLTDTNHFKQDDFELFVLDPSTNTTVAVAPVAPRGSGDARVRAVWAPPDHPLFDKIVRSERQGKPLILQENHPLARKAFARQSG